MQIIDEIQLDFSDVLIKPRRSSLESRSLVDISKDYFFNHSRKTTTGTGIMQSNMGTIGTFDVSRKMLANGLFAGTDEAEGRLSQNTITMENMTKLLT